MSTDPRGVQGAKELHGIAGIQGPPRVQRPVGTTGVQCERGCSKRIGQSFTDTTGDSICQVPCIRGQVE